mgnify:CR=1 FL=1
MFSYPKKRVIRGQVRPFRVKPCQPITRTMPATLTEQNRRATPCRRTLILRCVGRIPHHSLFDLCVHTTQRIFGTCSQVNTLKHTYYLFFIHIILSDFFYYFLYLWIFLCQSCYSGYNPHTVQPIDVRFRSNIFICFVKNIFAPISYKKIIK